MHQPRPATPWCISLAISLSPSLLPKTRILEVSRCLKAFCGLWQRQLMEICWVGALKRCSCLKGARPQSLTAWPLVKWRKPTDWLLSTVSPLFNFSVFQHITFSQSFQRSHFRTPLSLLVFSCTPSHVVQPVTVAITSSAVPFVFRKKLSARFPPPPRKSNKVH